ncbi:hypothetical protein [Candidatus Phytoplasma asteris]|uniref:hypothetical protein n=1 Tax=Candidatus Phytoplasma asteris TaxID=85620 RepID=UPI0039DFA8E4
MKINIKVLSFLVIISILLLGLILYPHIQQEITLEINQEEPKTLNLQLSKEKELKYHPQINSNILIKTTRNNYDLIKNEILHDLLTKTWKDCKSKYSNHPTTPLFEKQGLGSIYNSYLNIQKNQKHTIDKIHYTQQFQEKMLEIYTKELNFILNLQLSDIYLITDNPIF